MTRVRQPYSRKVSLSLMKLIPFQERVRRDDHTYTREAPPSLHFHTDNLSVLTDKSITTIPCPKLRRFGCVFPTFFRIFRPVRARSV